MLSRFFHRPIRADINVLPNDIIRKIAVEHLDDHEDIETFREVCSLWRTATNDVNYFQQNWLMLVDVPTSPYRRLYCLSTRTSDKIDLPLFDKDPKDNRRYFSSKGWLIAVSMKRAIIHFYDVVSKQVIKPPSLPIHTLTLDCDEWLDEFYLYQVSRFYFNRNSPWSDDFEVAMVFDMVKRIGFWKPGQLEWIKPVANFAILQIEDVCFFRGEFYSIDHYARVIAYNGSQAPKQGRIVADLRSQHLTTYFYVKAYIVALQTTLLVIDRRVKLLDCDDSHEYWTESFVLFEVNVDNGMARRVEGIGERALFVGHNSTFFVKACPSNKRGYRPNCIYFTDDTSEWYCRVNSPDRGGGKDMGVFCLEENKVVERFYYEGPQFDYETPPMWVQRLQQRRKSSKEAKMHGSFFL